MTPEAFASRVDKNGPTVRPGLTQCWVWTGAVLPPSKNTTGGYGHFTERGKNIYAHRRAFELAKGAIPDGAHVLHHCDNRRCVNPDHLYAGSRADNMRDMVARGRSVRGRRVPSASRPGETNPQARLTASSVVEMRSLYRTGELTLAALGERFGSNQANAHRIVTELSWKHVPGALTREERKRVERIVKARANQVRA